jgi:hypothetical protein
MYQTPNMTLTAWDQASDDFDHTQLAQNWVTVDGHNHDPATGGGVQIGTSGIAEFAVTTAQLAFGSVGSNQLQAGSIGADQLKTGAVTNVALAAGSVYGSVIPNAAIIAAMLDPTLIPIGAVMPWWRPPGSNATPGGFWEQMDGRAWSTITNYWDLNTGNIPDTRGVFVQGANLTSGPGQAIGTTGGSSTVNLAHSHNVNAHVHDLAEHTHGISVDGSHYHTWQGGLNMYTRTNCFTAGITVPGEFGGQYDNTFYSMYIKNILSNPNWYSDQNNIIDQVLDGPADMDLDGAHSHTGSTAAGGPAFTAFATSTTDTQLGSTAFEPPFVSLLYIMRCR